MKAFVAGATGETGRRIVQQLADRQIAIRALVRDSEKAAEILPSAGVERIEGDVSNRSQLKTAIADSTVVLCATGARPSFDPFDPYRVDLEGTKNLIEAAKQANIDHFVLVSSLCVSQFFHPLNLFWFVLFWKKQAEAYLQASGLKYTIVRPGGLTNSPPEGGLVISAPDTLFEGRIPRSEVARVCVESLFIESARDRILEIVSHPETPERDIADLLATSP